MKHGEDSKKKIEIVPYSGYKISKIKINEKEIEINANDEGIVVIDKLENIKENKNIRQINISLHSSQKNIEKYLENIFEVTDINRKIV